MRMKVAGKIGLTIGLFIGMMVAFVACEKTPPQVGQPTDPRDAFVGAYDYSTTGNVDIYMSGMKVWTVPLDKTGSFTISKYGEENQVVIVGAIFGERDSIRAEVTGNQLALENNSVNYSYGDATIQMMLSYEKANLVDNRLTWAADIMAMGTYSTYSVNGNGHISMAATKKQ